MRDISAIVLASVSPRRFELLTSLGIAVRVVPSRVHEGDRPGYAPRELAALYAEAKADSVSRREPDAFVVAADTVVDLDGVALGKPTDERDAARTLALLSGREHRVHTAYEARFGGRRVAATSTTTVRFAPLSEQTIAAYVATGEPMDKAGAYGIQGRGAALVERIDGDFYTVMGFPLGDFVRRLPDLGVRLPAATIASRG
jgi:septum formation protein